MYIMYTIALDDTASYTHVSSYKVWIVHPPRRYYTSLDGHCHWNEMNQYDLSWAPCDLSL